MHVHCTPFRSRRRSGRTGSLWRRPRLVALRARRAEADMATAVMQPTAVSFLSSSTGLLAMLDEEDNQLKAHALANINAVVPDFWAESEFCTGTAGARALGAPMSLAPAPAPLSSQPDV